MFRIVLHALGRSLVTLLLGIPPVPPIKHEQAMVVANHNTHMDIATLFRLFPLERVNRVRVVAAQDYFGAGIKGFLGRLIFNLILLDRRPSRARHALDPIVEALEQGFSIILFPEGTRGEPGVMQGFKSGMSQLAVDFPEIPVYPVYIHGIEKTLPRGKALFIPFNVRLEVMEPIFGRDYLPMGRAQGKKQFTADVEERFRSAAG